MELGSLSLSETFRESEAIFNHHEDHSHCLRFVLLDKSQEQKQLTQRRHAKGDQIPLLGRLGCQPSIEGAQLHPKLCGAHPGDSHFQDY